MAGKLRDLIVAYDIESNRTRRRVQLVLREWRLDGQKSVHECRLSAPMAEELFVQLCTEIDPETDRLLLAWVKGGFVQDGRRPPPEHVYRVG